MEMEGVSGHEQEQHETCDGQSQLTAGRRIRWLLKNVKVINQYCSANQMTTSDPKSSSNQRGTPRATVHFSRRSCGEQVSTGCKDTPPRTSVPRVQ